MRKVDSSGRSVQGLCRELSKGRALQRHNPPDACDLLLSCSVCTFCESVRYLFLTSWDLLYYSFLLYYRFLLIMQPIIVCVLYALFCPTYCTTGTKSLCSFALSLVSPFSHCNVRQLIPYLSSSSSSPGFMQAPLHDRLLQKAAFASSAKNHLELTGSLQDDANKGLLFWPYTRDTWVDSKYLPQTLNPWRSN